MKHFCSIKFEETIYEHVYSSKHGQPADRQTDRQIYTDKNSTNIQVKMSITHIKP